MLEDRWLNVDEIVEYLGVSRDTVYAWIAERSMPAHKVGRFWKFKREEVDGWVREGHAAEGRAAPPPPPRSREKAQTAPRRPRAGGR